MSTLSRTSIRIGTAAAAGTAALLLTAAPGFAQTESTPGNGGHSSATIRHESSQGTDWTAVGSGAAGGVVLAGGAFAMASVLRRRQQHPALQA